MVGLAEDANMVGPLCSYVEVVMAVDVGLTLELVMVLKEFSGHFTIFSPFFSCSAS